MKTKITKKGQVSLSDVPNAVLLLGVAAVIGVVMLILLSDVQVTAGEDFCEDQATHTTYNETSRECMNPSNTSDRIGSGFGVNASQDSQEGIDEVFENFDLIGLMIGLGVVLIILLGVFAFIGARRTGVF